MLNGISEYSFTQNPYIPALSAQRVQSAGVSRAVSPVAALPAAQPETPVQPVEPVRPTPDTAAVGGRTGLVRRWADDTAAAAGRSRMEYLDADALARLENGTDGPTANAAARAKAAYGAVQALSRQIENGARTQKAGTAVPGFEEMEGKEGAGKAKSAREVMEEGECETCAERKYQDGSDDPGVSFKTASHIDPDLAAAKVRGHEMEHVVREQAEALREDRKVISQSVSYHTGICPECGRAYVSGGTTRTTTMANNDAFAVKTGSGAKENGGFSALI